MEDSLPTIRGKVRKKAGRTCASVQKAKKFEKSGANFALFHNLQQQSTLSTFFMN